MKTSFFTIVAVLTALSGCSQRNDTSGESPQAENSIATQKATTAGVSRTTGEPRTDPNRNFDSGKGAPSLGGVGGRSNASVAAARGSAHDGVTDADHITALKRPAADATQAQAVKPQKGH
jgi:hypothetical protein